MGEEISRPERSRASDRGRPSRRAGSSSARSVTYNLNDPRWSQMWYLVCSAFSSPFFFASSSSSSFNQKDIDPSIYFYGAVILCPGVVKKPNLLAVAV